MQRRIVIACLVLIVPAIGISTCGLTYAQEPQTTPGGSSDNESKLNHWLASAGLKDTFDVIRVGEGPHPDHQYGLEMIQHLELRFKTASGDQASEAARFERILAEYETEHAMALSEKLFDTFVDIYAIDPRKACVDLHLYDSVYSVYASRADGSLKVSKGPPRSDIDSFSVNIPVIAAQQQFRARVGKQSASDPPNPKLVQAAVDKALRAYLDSISAKSSVKPDINSDTTNSNYIRLMANGLKGVVTEGFWDFIDILVFYSPDLASTPADAVKEKGVQWNFGCKVNVRYASGLRDPHPKDTDTYYPEQAKDFRTKLVHQLQTEMEKGIHD